MARGVAGHKKHCRCAVCKSMRKGARRGGGGKKKPHHHSPGGKAHVRKLRRELGQAKRGAAKASSNGDASSWARFNATVGRLERSIAAHRKR